MHPVCALNITWHAVYASVSRLQGIQKFCQLDWHERTMHHQVGRLRLFTYRPRATKQINTSVETRASSERTGSFPRWQATNYATKGAHSQCEVLRRQPYVSIIPNLERMRYLGLFIHSITPHLLPSAI